MSSVEVELDVVVETAVSDVAVLDRAVEELEISVEDSLEETVDEGVEAAAPETSNPQNSNGVWTYSMYFGHMP